jgi:hypothetical protein
MFKLFSFSIVAISAAFFATSASALPGTYLYKGKTYVMVSATDRSANTGNKACAAIGMKCVGYTAFNNDVCKAFHPRARTLVSVNGSKAGFFCDGAPQRGLACERAKNTCQVCPACNVNVDCTTDITSMNQFRETYAECAKVVVKSSSSKSVPKRMLSSSKKTGYGAPKLPPAGSTIGNFPGKKVCEFYQATPPGQPVRATKKLVTCAAYKAGDTFCALVMGSRLAKAEKCEENGIVVCSVPCSVNILRCAADINRPRGVNAAPLSFCTGASSSRAAVPPAGRKQPGDICKHGGECASGICIGTGRPYNQDLYQCSCKWDRLDFSCKK